MDEPELSKTLVPLTSDSDQQDGACNAGLPRVETAPPEGVGVLKAETSADGDLQCACDDVTVKKDQHGLQEFSFPEEAQDSQKESIAMIEEEGKGLVEEEITAVDVEEKDNVATPILAEMTTKCDEDGVITVTGRDEQILKFPRFIGSRFTLTISDGFGSRSRFSPLSHVMKYSFHLCCYSPVHLHLGTETAVDERLVERVLKAPPISAKLH